MRRLRAGALALLVGVLGGPIGGDAAPPRPVEVPPLELTVSVAPIPFGLTRPALEPSPPPEAPAPSVDLGGPPSPRFQSAVAKPLPLTRDPGGLSCTFVLLRGAAGLAECGIQRVLQGDLRGAREALQDSLDRDGRGPVAATTSVWLAEVASRENRLDEAERRYRAALALGPPPDLVPHAGLGLAWVVLRRGELAEAGLLLAQVLAATPVQPVALVARFLEGVVRLLGGQPGEALAVWDAVAGGGPPVALAEELLFWRAVAQARLGRPAEAVTAFDAFLATVAATHPLVPDAVLQSGWAALALGSPSDAIRRFLWAERTSLRAELRPPLRAGQVRAYLALGDATRARDTARALTTEAPRDPIVAPALLLLGDDASRRDAVAEAVDIYRRLQTLPPPAAFADYVAYRLAELLEREGRTAEAQRHYQTLRDGGRVEATAQRAAYRLGVLALRAQRPADARAEAEALLRAGVVPELREPVLLLAAEGAARADDPNRAAALFQLALRDYPTSPRAGAARLGLGWALSRDGEPESALREWRAAGLAPDLEVAAQAYLAIAQLTLAQGREADALAALRDVGRLAPAHPLAELITLDRGVLHVRARAYASAVQDLEPLVPAISAPVRQALLRRALGIARYHLGQYEAAERQFRQAVHWAPAEPSSWLGVGVAALAQSRYLEAEEALGRARLAAAPEIAIPAFYGLVLVAARRTDREAFRQRASEFVDRYPTEARTPALLYGLETMALEGRDLDQADFWVKRLVRDHPRSEYVGDALQKLADAAGERPALARQAYRELVARLADSGNRADARFGLAEAALALGDAAEAQRAIEGLLAESPGDPRAPRAYALLIRAHEALGQRDRVLTTTQAFLARFPRDPLAPAVQLTRGHLLLAERRWEEARVALEAARQADEVTVAAQAHFWLGELYRARDDHEAAIAAYLGATYLYPETDPWAARGLQGAAQSYLARQMRREAAILLRKLVVRPGVEPALREWARQALTQLGPIPGEETPPALRRGAVRP